MSDFIIFFRDNNSFQERNGTISVRFFASLSGSRDGLVLKLWPDRRQQFLAER
jgi:hypothetical protein